MNRKLELCVMLELPRPISTNCLFSNAGRKRVTSKAYKEWQDEALIALMEQRPGRVEGPFALTIRVPSKWRGDLSNSCKAIEDLLVTHGVTEDDRYAEKILLEKWDASVVSVMVCSTRAQA